MRSHYQIAVVGGGPAGLSAATAAATAGANVVLLDENDSLGGQLRYRLVDVELTEHRPILAPHLAKAMSVAAESAGVALCAGHRVWGLFANNVIGVQAGGQTKEVSADRIVLASGSLDRSLVFPGGSLPGVLTERALLIVLHLYRVRPGRRFAIVGNGDRGEELRRAIELAGGEVVVEARDVGSVQVIGETGVDSISVNGTRYAVDIVVTSAGRVPDIALAMMAECRSGRDVDFGFLPAVDAQLQTTAPGLYLAGDCAGPDSIESAIAEGTYAGTAAAASLGFVADADLATERDRYLALAGQRAVRAAQRAGNFVQIDRTDAGSL